MPTYQYKCLDCDYEFEEFQSISAKPIGTCPECGGKPERIITGGIGFVLHGSGFYSTDYRSESYKEGMKKDEVSAKSNIPAPAKKKDTSSGEKKKDGK